MESAFLTLSDSQKVEIGHPVDYRRLVTCNVGDEPLTLRKAWLVHVQPGLKLLGFSTVTEINPPSTELHFPPAHGKPLPGRVVKPKEVVNFAIGTTLPISGARAYRGLALEYTVGSQNFVKVFDISLRLCSPPEKYPGFNSCRPPVGENWQNCLLPQDPKPDSDLRVCDRKPS